MTAAGYNVVYKGKWHCVKPARLKGAVPADLEKYGFTRWNPPDAGANQTVARGRRRLLRQRRSLHQLSWEAAAGTEGALQYLTQPPPRQQPFFMVVSVVNPHDVLLYPKQDLMNAGYDDSWLEGTSRRRRPTRRTSRRSPPCRKNS